MNLAEKSNAFGSYLTLVANTYELADLVRGKAFIDHCFTSG